MASQLTQPMEAYIASHPNVRTVALERDAVARAYFGDQFYEMYEQGCAQVIAHRSSAPAARVGATSTPGPEGGRKVHCSICRKDVHDFSRHNREMHIQDPGKTFYCPYQNCQMKTMRDGQTTIDDHLAAVHSNFRNMSGRGGDLLNRCNKRSVLNTKLSIASARAVAKHRQSKVAKYVKRRAKLIEQLHAASVSYPKLEAATLPNELGKDAVDIQELSKADAISHAISVGTTLNQWDALFEKAGEMLK